MGMGLLGAGSYPGHERVVGFAGARLAALVALRHAVSVILLHNRTSYLLLTNDSKSYL